MSYHVRACIIQKNEIVFSRLYGLYGFVGGFGGAHFRDFIEVSDRRGGHEHALFAGPRLFGATIEEVGDMRVFFGFGDAELDFPVFTEHFSERVGYLFGGESDVNGEVSFVLGHGNEVDIEFFGSRESVEIGKGERFGDFARAIFAVVEENDGIAVLYGADRFPVFGEHNGFEVFVGDALLVGGFRVGDEVFGSGESFGHGAIGFFDTIPVVVAVHAPVSTADTCESSDAEHGSARHDFFQRVYAGCGRGVASVGKGVDEDFGEVVLCRHLEEHVEMVFVGVDGTFADESHDVEGAAIFFDARHGIDEGFVFEKRSVLDGERDAREVLVDDAPRADCHVSHLAVSRGIPGEADGDAGRLKGGHRVVFVEFIDNREMRFANGVALSVTAQSPSVEDDEYNWSVHRRRCQEKTKNQSLLSILSFGRYFDKRDASFYDEVYSVFNSFSLPFPTSLSVYDTF